MKYIYTITLLTLLFTSSLSASEITKVNFPDICNENWLDTSISDNKKYILVKPSKLKELCPSLMSGKPNKEQLEKLVQLTYKGNITSWFILGYSIFEFDTSENKNTDFAIEVLNMSAFWRNPYAHAYLYKIYTSEKYGYKNEVQALLSLEHYKNSLEYNTMMQTNLTSKSSSPAKGAGLDRP